MKADKSSLQFFLGANTPQGFVSRFDQLANVNDSWRTFIIKGGPGCGKSTLLRKIANELSGDPSLEYIHCSSDADSLDGIISPKYKISAADGTKPHVLEPKYPGAFESTIDLSRCWDEDILFERREEIVALTDSCSKSHEHCCRFLCAAGSLCSDTYRLAMESVYTDKLAGYCFRLAEKELPQNKLNAVGVERVRFLSAITNKGTLAFTNTAIALCPRLYLICDDYGAVSRLILSTMRTKALAAGHDVISCLCPLSPFDKLEQLLIPSLGFGFITSNRFHDFTETVNPYRIVNSQRFSDNDKLKKSKKRISFNRKSTTAMITQAEVLLAEAKTTHDKLEAIYGSAIDFAKLNQISDEVIDKIRKII